MATGHMDRNQTRDSVERTSDRVDGVIRTVVDSVKDQSNKYLDEAKSLADSGKQMAKEKIKDVEDAVKHQSDTLAEYIKDQPLKSILMAFAAGYVLSCFSKRS